MKARDKEPWFKPIWGYKSVLRFQAKESLKCFFCIKTRIFFSKENMMSKCRYLQSNLVNFCSFFIEPILLILLMKSYFILEPIKSQFNEYYTFFFLSNDKCFKTCLPLSLLLIIGMMS